MDYYALAKTMDTAELQRLVGEFTRELSALRTDERRTLRWARDKADLRDIYSDELTSRGETWLAIRPG